MDLIIKETDFRYKDLDKILSYDLDNLRLIEGPRSWYYYIPPELVINEYGRIKKVHDGIKDPWENYLYCKKIWDLEYYCRITPEDFFCLFSLHINDRDLRPKCDYCKETRLNFVSLSQGYGRMGNWDPSKKHYCCNECQRYGHEEENKRVLNSPIPTIKRFRTMFLSYGNLNDECVLYITYTSEGLFKYGVTQYLEGRTHSIQFNGFTYLNPRVLYRGTREQVANLESIIKLHFDGSEYLNDSKEFFDFYRTLDLDNIINPFSD